MPRKSMRRGRRGGDLLSPSTWSMPSNPFASDEDKQPINYGTGMGGRRRRRRMRGGDYSDNISLNGLAANAAPFSNGNTATAQLVGGRTRRRRHRKSCKKSCRKH